MKKKMKYIVNIVPRSFKGPWKTEKNQPIKIDALKKNLISKQWIFTILSMNVFLWFA